MHAVRNIRLCTKDCLCLYVCPTGATDTETGQIDASKCTGCGMCAQSCPSGAISMVPEKYPPQQLKTQAIKTAMLRLAQSKAVQEQAAREMAGSAEDPVMRRFAKALSKSNRLMAEDILREAGFMLPQSKNVRELLKAILETEHSQDFPVHAVNRLLELLPE